MKWDPTIEQGILCDFDLVDFPNYDIGGFIEENVSMVAELLECKELSNHRKTRLSNDLIEPAVWRLVATSLATDVLFEH